MLRSCFVLFVCCVTLCVGYDEPRCFARNEEVKCVHQCPGEKTCRTRQIFLNCVTPQEPCENKCVCKEGYYRNPLGECVSEEQCDQCKGENEYFACNSVCDTECAKILEQNRTNCPIASFVCVPQCYCDDGYARDEKGVCIPVKKCPPLPTCTGENEEYRHCKRSCPPELCLSILARFKCDADPPCKAGCQCKPGYLRERDGSPCVPICDCPEMKNAPECRKKQ